MGGSYLIENDFIEYGGEIPHYFLKYLGVEELYIDSIQILDKRVNPSKEHLRQEKLQLATEEFLAKLNQEEARLAMANKYIKDTEMLVNYLQGEVNNEFPTN
jgi:hypothetical protein